MKGVEPTPEQACPISGEYTGVIPDSMDLCARLWSDCRAPELMYYEVSDCVSKEIYEEREYKCLGHWEVDNQLYTYTKRLDISANIYECFVGSIIPDKDDIYIKEAGEHCQRKIDPVKYGMKLVKKGMYNCVNKNVPTPRPKPPMIPTKPWNIDVECKYSSLYSAALT